MNNKITLIYIADKRRLLNSPDTGGVIIVIPIAALLRCW